MVYVLIATNVITIIISSLIYGSLKDDIADRSSRFSTNVARLDGVRRFLASKIEPVELNRLYRKAVSENNLELAKVIYDDINKINSNKSETELKIEELCLEALDIIDPFHRHRS